MMYMSDKIIVISQNTYEREKEVKELFEKIKPYLDKGYTYRASVKIIGKASKNTSVHVTGGWFKDLKDYGESQGYEYKKYS